jgi:thiamine-phosphate pyrophosphorylase
VLLERESRILERVKAMGSKKIGRLHVITDTQIQDRLDHVELARLAIDGGADTIQLRDKRISTKELIRVAEAIKKICEKHRVTFIVNDRVDVAYAVDADGVHLGQDDLPISFARKILGDKIIGGSAGDPRELQNCISQGADYVGFGPIFQTSTKEDAGPEVGLKALKEIVRLSPIPVIAIGGIHQGNLQQVLAQGPHGIAVVSCVARAMDPREATRELREILTRKGYIQ